jgi:hypothetical protein
MIAIGCATTDERAFRAAGALTVEALDEGSSLLLRRHRYESVAVAYNEMLAAARDRDDLEAVVLVHQDAVVEDGRDVLADVREILAASEEVAVVWALDGGRPGEVPPVSGTLLALSPWAARNLRFDPAAAASPDTSALDVALQARAAGRRAVGAPLEVSRAWSPAAPAARRRELHAMVELRRR